MNGGLAHPGGEQIDDLVEGKVADAGEKAEDDRRDDRDRRSRSCDVEGALPHLGELGELVDGPTRDFNLMWKREAVEAELWHRPLVGTMVLFVEPGETWAVHALAGQARFADDSGLDEVQLGDTAVLVADDARRRFVLDGGGELLLIRIAPRAGG